MGRNNNRLRAEYLTVLSRQEYGDMVHIVHDRLDLESFLTLLSRHQSVLSLPGRGYDCCRTWQTIAVGSVPLVFNDAKFDQRLHHDTGPRYIPSVDELSPTSLAIVLAGLGDP